MGSAPSAESRTRQSAMTPALSLPFSCIKESTKQHQAKRTMSIATLVIREPSAATLQGRCHRGTHPTSAAPAHRPGRTVPLFSFGDTVPAVDRVHGLHLSGRLHLYGAPRLLFPSPCGNPSRPNVWAEEARDTYKGRRSPFGLRVRSLVGSLGSQVHRLGAQKRP